jgi:serine/threonine protein kinase
MSVRVETNAEPIPGYRLIERIGGGGFGEVWKAEAPGGLMKAIKFVFGELHTADDQEGVRAEQELKAITRVKTVRHPYILSLERYDIIDGRLIIVMELADRNLWDRFRECRSQGLPGIPRTELLGYMAETAEALDLMNTEYQLQHLDIKPQNLFLVHNHIKVADFGLVKDLQGMVASVTGGVTPVYAAPETFDGWISRYCDQYSLAIVYQELLTGQRPFNSNNVRQLVLLHLQAAPDLSSLPAGDRPAIARALAKIPENRHATCCALIKELQKAEARERQEGAGPVQVETPQDPSPFEPMPSHVVTPDDAPPGGPVTRWLRTHETAPKQTPVQLVSIPDIASDSAPSTREVAGDGQLFPALVIGLGNVGLEALKRFGNTIGERFGTLDALPNLRLLYIDTDSEALRLAANSPDGGEVTRNEMLLAPLHRPSHYLKPREGRVRIDTWLDTKMLYRIPRQAMAGGVRALGRLAFVDNYRPIAMRLRSELEACINPEALSEAARRTGLGIRTNRPRVYVVTSLAGGTGSGMFLDAAYVVRTVLRQLGFDHADVVGLFLLPSAQRGASQPTELGNAYAALTELNYFSSQGTTFSASYDTHDARVTGPIVDAGAPFSRCFLLPAARPVTEGAEIDEYTATMAARAAESLALVSHFLVHDTTTSLGRSADASRRDRLMEVAGHTNAKSAAPGLELYCQTMGMQRLVWPRQALLQHASRRLCKRLVERWMTKDARPIRGSVHTWVEEQWVQQELGADALITELQQACVRALKTAPDQAFAKMFEPITILAAPDAGADLSAELVAESLAKLEEVLGRPQESAAVMRQDKSGPPGQVEIVLRDVGEEMLDNLTQKMAEMTVCLVEQPVFRLAGAEEAIRQITTLIEQALQAQEQIARELSEQAYAAHGGILAIYKAVKSAKGIKAPPRRAGEAPPNLAAQANELLRTFCKSRYQSLILQRVISIFVSLRGQLSDQMREVGFCRNRLTELAKSFGTPTRRMVANLTAKKTGTVRYLFPTGCRTLEDAVTQLLDSISEEHLNDLDERVEVLIRRDFTALVHVCLTAANLLRNMEHAMQKETEMVLEGRLVGTKVTEMYLATQEDGGPVPEAALEDAIARGFDDAAPNMSGLINGSRPARSSEIFILAAPADAAADKTKPNLKDAAQNALDGQHVLIVDAGPGTAGDEILYYREEVCLSLTDLNLLGPIGREAYRQMNAVDHFTPHARIDITEWEPAAKEA